MAVKKNTNSGGYSDEALLALKRGTYGKETNRNARYSTSQDQLRQVKELPTLKPMATVKAEKSITSKPKAQDNYVVHRDKYDELMQDSGLANDIMKLATINYSNANQDATVSQEWADTFGAKAITGGLTKTDYIESLKKKYGLSSRELNDMALTFHSDANKKEVEDYARDLENIGKNHAVLGSLGSFVGTLGSGVEGLYNTVVGGITGDDRYLSNMFSTTKNSPRQGVKENIKSDLGKGVYDVGMGIGDMAVGTAAGSAPAILAGNTANEAQASARERGSSVRRASAYAAGAGALDYITNTIGLDKAKKKAISSIKGAGLKKFIGQNFMAGLGEAGENVIQDIGQSFLDAIINGENAELNQSFQNKVASGMSEDEAFSETAKEYASQLAMSGGLGFGMGSAMQAGASALPALRGMNRSKSDVPNIDPEIQNAIETSEAAQAEIQNLQNQLPKVEAQSAPKITLTPEESARLQQSKPAETTTQISPEELAEINNEFGNIWADEPKAEATPTKPVENKTVNESAPRNPRIVAPLEGAELEQANARRGELKSEIERKKIEVETNKRKWETIPDKQNRKKAAAEKVVKASERELKALQDEDAQIKKNMKGYTMSSKEYIKQVDNDLYKQIYSRNEGLMDNLNYAAKFAGDSPEAKQLAKEIKDIVSQYIETGDAFNTILSPQAVEKIAQLDDLAKSVDKEYLGYHFNDIFGPRYIEQTDSYDTKKPSIWNKITENDRLEKINQYYQSNFGQADTNAPKMDESTTGQDRVLTPEETKVLQDVVDGKYDIPETGNPAPKKDSIPDDIRAYMNNKLAMIQKIQQDAKKGVNGLEIMKTTDDFNRYEADLINKYPDWFDNGSFKEADYNRLMRMEEAAKKAAKTQKKPKEMPKVKPTEQTQANAPKQNDPDVKSIKNSFRGKARYINDSNNEYAKQFIKALDEFEKAPSEATYQKVKQAHEDYAANSGSKNMKNWYGTWYTKTYEPDGINKQLDSLAEKYGIKTDASKNEVPNVKKTEPVNNEVPKVEPNEPTPPKPPKNTPPNNEPPKTNLSKRYETLKNSDLFKKSEANMKMLETSKEKGVFDKDIESRKEAQEEALNEYLADPEKAREHNLNKKWDSGKDVDTSMLILKDALEKGDQAETNLTLLKQVEMNKGAGRQLRANRDYAGTKEKTLQKAAEFMSDKADKVLSNKKSRTQYEAMVERIVNGDLSELSSKLKMDEANIDDIKKAIKAGAGKADIVKMIGMYQAVGKTGISADTLKKVSEIYDKIEKGNYGLNSRKRAELEADAFKVLAQDVGGKRTWREKWDAWRYLAMLGNPKTHLRNILGNTTHYMITEAKDNLAGALETALDKVSKNGIERTKAILTADDDGLVKRSTQDADDNAYASLNDSGSKYNVKDEINRARDSFNSKTLSKIDEFNSSMLDKEDYSALKRKYSKSLARYLKANGANESIFDATDDASKALLDKARTYAIDQAKQATFHEYSKLAETLTNASRNLANSDKARDKAASYVLEGLLPFKKTPINILKQGGKYSPISLAKGLYKAFDAVKTGNSTASDAIDDLASGLTGSGIMALGGFLASKGMLTGSADDNYDVDNAEKDQGKQNYALKIGDSSYTLDWLAPASMPLFVGVELYKQMQKKDKNLDVNDFLSALTTIAEPITEMSMLQGINDTLEQLAYSGVNSAVGTFAASTGLGYITQGVPTIAGQIARAVDNTRRSTYSDKKGAEKQIDRAITKVKNKLPVVSSSSEPYIDAKGRVEKNEGFFASKLGNGILPNLMDQMLSPGYYKQGTVSTVDKELNRLYEATGESPYLNVSSGKVNNEQLSKSDFTKYQTQYGQTNTKLYSDIIGSDEYKQLDDAQRLKILDSAKSMSKMIADHEIGGKELSDSQQKLYDTYKKEGLDSISSRLKEQAKVGAINDKYGTEMRLDTYEKWSTDPELKKLGGPEAYAKNYAKAKELDMDVKTYIKKEAEAPGTAAKEVQMKQDAVDNGFVTKDGNGNLNAYTKAVDMFGEDQKKIQAYSTVHSKGYTKNSQLLPELVDNSSFNDEDRGKILMSEHGKTPDKLGKTAKGAYDVGGYAGVYYYWMLKELADTNHNGSIDKKEKKALMNSDNKYVMQVPDNIYNYLGGAKW